MIPKDPMILLSYVNTQLRDYYDSLEALCTCRGLNRESLLDRGDDGNAMLTLFYMAFKLILPLIDRKSVV